MNPWYGLTAAEAKAMPNEELVAKFREACSDYADYDCGAAVVILHDELLRRLNARPS